jgi:hypothetical protein
MNDPYLLENIHENQLNTRQKYALEMMKRGKNIFLTGQAGTGKSYTIKAFVKHCIQNKITYAVTSTTGVSALLIGGTTLHSWAGILLGMEDKFTLLDRVQSRDKAHRRWLYTKVLIIDEISMMCPVLLEKLDYIGKKVRKSTKPFGGIQLVLCGDFAQLPPVKSDFCFKFAIWDLLIDTTIYLEENMRQTNSTFKQLLSEVRLGDVTPETIKLLQTRLGAYIETPEGILPTKLFSHRATVAKINHDSLLNLVNETNPIVTYHAKDNARRKDGRMIDSRYKEQYLGRIDKIFQAPKTLELCIGAQVMLLFNLDLDAGLANGSRGVAIGFTNGLPIVRFMNGIEIPIDKAGWSMKIADNVIVSRRQIPLLLAWACTIHKCINGNTLVSDRRGLKYIKDYTDVDGWSDIQIPINTFSGIEQVSKIYKGEIEPSIKITTTLGYTLEGSYRHPVMSKDENGEVKWIRLPDLTIGTPLAMQVGNNCGRNIAIEFKESITPMVIDYKLSYIIGLLVGDGFYYENNDEYIVEFYNDKLEILEKYQNILKEKFGIICTVDSRKNYFCDKEIP